MIGLLKKDLYRVRSDQDNNKMNIKILEDIGLSKAEIKVYLSLLGLGSVPSGKITRETNMRKSTIYESIRRLQEKGLVSYVIKDGMKYFEGTDPNKIIDFIHDKKRKLDETENEARKLIQDLKKGLDTIKPQAEAHVLVGIEGFKTMRRDALRNSKGEILLIGAIAKEDEVIPGYFEEWNKERQKHGIKLKILYKESARNKIIKSIIGNYFEHKFLSNEIESPAVTNIYGDRVVNLV